MICAISMALNLAMNIVNPMIKTDGDTATGTGCERSSSTISGNCFYQNKSNAYKIETSYVYIPQDLMIA